MTGGRRLWLWVEVWACVYVCLALADEEDPLQHEAQVAARDRQLTRVLRLLGVEGQEGRGGLPDEEQGGEACSRRTLDLTIPAAQLAKFTTETRAALRLANLLNNLFVGVREGFEPTYPAHMFHALVRAALEHEPSITSSSIAFLRGEYHPPAEEEPQEVFGAYGWRREGGDVATTDLTSLYNHSLDHPSHQDTKWFTAHSSYRFSRRRINSSLGGEEGVPPGPITLTRADDGQWASQPLLDCGASNLWVVAYSLPFFSRVEDGLYAKIKGVVLVTVPLREVDLDQCDVDDLLGPHLFADTHKCDVSTTQCESVSGLGFRRGGYRCQCHPGYYLPRPGPGYFSGEDIEAAYSTKQSLDAFRNMAGGGSGVGAGRRGGRGNSSGGDGGGSGGGGGGGGRGGRIQEHHQNQQHQQHSQQQVHHQNGPGTTVQCGPNQYRLGLYGWRRRCLYGLVLLLLVMVILNLALTLFILRVLDFTTEGIGGLQIVRGGMIASGEVHVMERLVAARISTPPHVPIRILAAENFSIAATNKDGRSNRIFMNSEAMQCTSDQLVIRDKQGRLLFSATQDEVLVGARQLTVKGEGGAVFSGSVQTAHVTAPVKDSLLLESLTRSLEITAPQGVALESRAGTISARCLHDFILQSRGGMIKFDTPNIFIQGLRTSTLQTNDQRPARPDVYQVCVCSSGKLFLATPLGVCAADQKFCK